MPCRPYINNFKGRPNRRERARHIRDEFDAIEDALALLQAKAVSSYTIIYTNAITDQTAWEIDPANGAIQEITLTQTTTISVKAPLNNTTTRRISLLIHGANIRVVNGWGPQTWKEKGNEDWLFLLTGTGRYASMLIEFTWDGLAWIGIAASSSSTVAEYTFPFISNLTSVGGAETLGFARTSHATSYDTNERLWTYQSGIPRFFGSRNVYNWVADPNDLQSVAWETANAAVATEAAAGPSGGDVDKITFSATGGEVRCWMLPNFGRYSVSAAPIKFTVRFKAKMAALATGSMRVTVSWMGAKSEMRPGLSTHKTITVNLNDEWRDYGYTFNFISNGEATAMDLSSSIEKRTLVQLAFISPSGSVGSPVLVTGVQVEIPREGYPEIPGELQEGTIGASLTLAATAGSTGTWDNGTKAMTLDIGEYVDFQDSLVIGKTYLMVCRVNSGYSADFIMDDDQTFWQAYRAHSETRFVKDAAFTFKYDGGVAKWGLTGGASGAYTVNVYECTGNLNAYDTEIGNSIDPATYLLTEATGVPVATYFAQGLVVEAVPSTNLLDVDEYRSFFNWTSQGLTDLTDVRGKISSARSEYGIDGLPGKGTLLQDTKTTELGYKVITKTIPADTNEYAFMFFIRKVFDVLGVQKVFPQNLLNVYPVPASRYIDFVFTLKNGVDSIGGQTVRLDIVDGRFTGWQTSDYNQISGVDYTYWWRPGLTLVNDGTMTEAEVKIFPAPGTTFDPGETNVTLNGYVIIDWAQLELEDGTYVGSGPVVGGQTRDAESLTTVLPDGYLYNSLYDQIGDVTSGAFQFDDDDTISKNVLFLSYQANFSVNSMHEFGPSDGLICEATVDDEDEDPLLDEQGNQICEEADAMTTLVPMVFKIYINDVIWTLPTPEFREDGVTPFVYDYTVDWGSGPIAITTWNDPNAVFDGTGLDDTFTVTIDGLCEGFRARDYSGREIVEIVAWGNTGMPEFIGAFDEAGWEGALVISATDTPALAGIDSAKEMFNQAEFSAVDISTWDVSDIQDFSYMFYNGIFDSDISAWTPTNATTFDEFLGDSGLVSGFSITNYNALLEAWSLLTFTNSGLLFTCKQEYNTLAAKAAHDILTSAPNNWVITDLGYTGPPPPPPPPPTIPPAGFAFQITTAGGTFRLPTSQYWFDGVTAATYNYDVDWGDGSPVDTITAWDQAEATHTYAAGTYTITITGTMEICDFFNGPNSMNDDALQVSYFLQWDDVGLKEFIYMFEGCKNMAYGATDAPILATASPDSYSLYDMFYDAGSNLSNGDLYGDWSAWNTANITEWDYMFSNSSYNPNCENWDVSLGQSFYTMFDYAIYFNRDLSAWTPTAATDFTAFITNTTSFSTTNYDLLLAAWSLLTFDNSSLTFQCNAQYTEVAARAVLTSAPNSWTITDLGPV